MSLSDVIDKTVINPNQVKFANVSFNSLHLAPPSAGVNPNDEVLTWDPSSGLVHVGNSSGVIGNGFTQYQSTPIGQTIVSSVQTKVDWVTPVHSDPAVTYDIVNRRFVTSVAGYFMISYTIYWTGTLGLGAWYSFVTTQGGTQRYSSDVAFQPGGTFRSVVGSYNVQLGAGEFFDVEVFQNSTFNASIQGVTTDGVNFSSINIVRLSPAGVF